MAKHHDKKREPTPGLPDLNGAGIPPVHLHGLSGLKGQCEEGAVAHRTHQTHVFLEDAEAALISLGPQLLEDLRATVGVPFQKPLDPRLEGIQLAAPLPSCPSRRVFFRPRVFGYCLGVDPHGAGDLLEVKPLLLVKMTNLAPPLIVNHSASLMARRNSPRHRTSPATPSIGGFPELSISADSLSTLWASKLKT